MKLKDDVLMDLLQDATSYLYKKIREENKLGRIKEYMTSIGMKDILPIQDKIAEFETNPDGKILIIGDSAIEKHIIFGITKKLKISKNRIELELGYYENKRFNFNKLHYNPNYRLILVGPLPHSTHGKGDASSVISKMKTDEGYPKIIRLLNESGELRITKNSLKNTLANEIKSGYLKVDI